MHGCFTHVGRMLDVGSTVGAGRKINGSWFMGTWRDGREIEER